MTTNDIDAIRKREQAATPGPWATDPDSAWRRCHEAHEYVYATDPTDRAGVIALTGIKGEHVRSPRDAAFIAAARTDVPALCDEVEQLRAELADVAAAIAPTVTISPAPAAARFLHSLYQDWVKTAHERLEQVDKLTAELAAADQQIASMRAAIDEADEAEAAR